MPQNDYELPTTFNRGAMPDDDDELPPISTMLSVRGGLTDQVEDNRLAWLMLATALSMLILTVVPVVADLPYVTPWFPGDALWRLFDPPITLPLNLFIMTRATIMSTGGKSRYWGVLSERTVAWLWWSIGAAIYVQGHGIHTAAAMFKHPVQEFNEDNPQVVTAYPVLNDIYLNMEDLWEHKIGHYMYAFGGMWMSWVQLFAFRNEVHGPLRMLTKIVWIVGSVVYGLLLAGVAIEFPYGLYVGLVYTVVIITVCVLMMTLNQRGQVKGGIFSMGKRMVLQYYLIACIIGLIIVIGWIGKYGFQNRKAAGVATS